MSVFLLVKADCDSQQSVLCYRFFKKRAFIYGMAMAPASIWMGVSTDPCFIAALKAYVGCVAVCRTYCVE